MVGVLMEVDTFALLRDWQEHLCAAGRLCEKTRAGYLRALLAFLAEVLQPLETVSQADIARVLAKQTTRAGHRDLMLKALYSFYRWAHRTHGFADPTQDFYLSRKRRPHADYLRNRQLLALFEGADAVDPRARPTFELMYGTASRIHQITELRPEDVDVDERTVHFELGVKNGETYSLWMAPRAFAAALRLLELGDYHPRTGTRRPGKLVGVSDNRVRQWLEMAAQEGGVGRSVYPHLLRKTALTNLANDPEVSIAALVKVANWRDASPMPHYVLAKNRQEREALGRL